MATSKQLGLDRSGRPRVDVSDTLIAPGQISRAHDPTDEISDLEGRLKRMLDAHWGEGGLVRLQELADKKNRPSDHAFAVIEAIRGLRRRIATLELEAAAKIESSGQVQADTLAAITDDHPYTQPDVIS